MFAGSRVTQAKRLRLTSAKSKECGPGAASLDPMDAFQHDDDDNDFEDSASGEEVSNEETSEGVEGPAFGAPAGSTCLDYFRDYDNSGGYDSSEGDVWGEEEDAGDDFRPSVMKMRLAAALRDVPASNVKVTFGGLAPLPSQPGLRVDGVDVLLPLNDTDGARLYAAGDVSPHGQGIQTVIDPIVRSSREFKAVGPATDAIGIIMPSRQTTPLPLVSLSPPSLLLLSASHMFVWLALSPRSSPFSRLSSGS